MIGAAREQPLLAVGWCVVVGGFFLHSRYWGGFLVDDAFITFRHVDNFVDGRGLVFNVGERVEGYSNFSWAMLLAAGAKLGVSPPELAPLLGRSIGIATMVGVAVAARRIFGVSRWTALGAAAVLAAAGPWVFWTQAGLESTLFSALCVALVAQCVRCRAGSARSVAGVFGIAALLVMTRPEGVFAFPVLLVWLVLQEPKNWGKIALGALAFAVPIGAWCLWRWSYYGSFLPNPVVAKVGGGVSAVPRGLDYSIEALVEHRYLVLVPLVVAGLAKTWSERSGRVLAGAIALYLAFIVSVGGDGLYKARFFGHATPLLVLLAAAGIDRLARVGRWWPLVCSLWMAVELLIPTVAEPFFDGVPFERFRSSERSWEQIGHVLAERAPPDLVLATNVAGKLPYYSKRPTIDLLGLCDATIARTPVAEEIGTGYAGHERAAPIYVLERKPDLLFLSVLNKMPESLFRDATGVAAFLDHSVLSGYASMLRSRAFAMEYRPGFLRLPTGEWANVYVRMRGRALLMPREQLLIAPWVSPPDETGGR